MQMIITAANYVAWSVINKALLGVLVVFGYWVAFDFIEGWIEKMLFGETFAHVFDVVFGAGFIAFSMVVVYRCAINNYNV